MARQNNKTAMSRQDDILLLLVEERMTQLAIAYLELGLRWLHDRSDAHHKMMVEILCDYYYAYPDGSDMRVDEL